MSRDEVCRCGHARGAHRDDRDFKGAALACRRDCSCSAFRSADGAFVAPNECIVCGKKPPTETPPPGTSTWHYLAGVIPIAALACSKECAEVAVERHMKTGRVDASPSVRS